MPVKEEPYRIYNKKQETRNKKQETRNKNLDWILQTHNMSIFYTREMHKTTIAGNDLVMISK